MKKLLILFALLALFIANCEAGGRPKRRGRPISKGRPSRPKDGSRYRVQVSELSLTPGGGLRIAYPAENGVAMVSFHYSINQEVHGFGPTHYNFDIRQPNGNEFVHENTNINLRNGDVVNYWVFVLQQGSPFHLFDQQWIAQGVTTPAPPTAPPKSDNSECTEYPCLIFEDDFNSLNFNTWEHEITMSGGGNWEFQYYTNNRTNSFARDGLLYIKPTLTSDKYGEAFLSSGTLDLWGIAPPNYCTANSYYGCSRAGNPNNYVNPIQSARLRTIRSFNFRYGKVEVEAQMPKGDWIWPAIWMLSEREAYGGWPASGEIDLVESRGNLNLSFGGESKGHDMMGSTLHWGPYFPKNGYEKTAVEKHSDFADSMHKYGLEWDENSLKLLLDEEVIMTVDPSNGGFWEFGDFGLPDNSNPWRYGSKMAPFDQPFYFILNVAVGGSNGFFPDAWQSNPAKPWLNTSPTAMKDFWEAKDNWYPTWNPDVDEGEQAAMKVNYIRVWKTKPDPE